MKEIKKYTDVTRFGKTGTTDAIIGAERISITEKIDGANSSFTYDENGINGVSCYSRNNLLHEDLRLSGFFDWVQENIVPIKDKLIPTYRYFGEWLCLSGDTIIKKTSGGKRGNYMTMREMYKYSIILIFY